MESGAMKSGSERIEIPVKMDSTTLQLTWELDAGVRRPRLAPAAPPLAPRSRLPLRPLAKTRLDGAARGGPPCTPRQ